MNAKMSKNFDKRLLNSMVGKQIPVDSFEEETEEDFQSKKQEEFMVEQYSDMDQRCRR